MGHEIAARIRIERAHLSLPTATSVQPPPETPATDFAAELAAATEQAIDWVAHVFDSRAAATQVTAHPNPNPTAIDPVLLELARAFTGN